MRHNLYTLGMVYNKWWYDSVSSRYLSGALLLGSGVIVARRYGILHTNTIHYALNDFATLSYNVPIMII